MNTTTARRVAVIMGSVRDGRFGPFVGAWVARRLAGWGVDADTIDLAERPDAASFGASVEAADAIIVITPEYNHSYPGPLKTAIDLLHEQWRAKPVAFVSYGGLAGGLRAVEALRPVFAELHAVTIRETVSLHNPWGPAADPAVDYPDEAADDALRRLYQQLLWWADALHHARRRTPYPA